MKMLSRTLSLSRIPLGVLACWLAVSGEWTVALICLAVGLVTDGLDGCVAEAAGLDQKEELYDGFGDLFLTVGAVAGVILAGAIPWSIVIAALVMTAVIWTPIITGRSYSRLRLFCEGLNSFYNAAVIVGCCVIYLSKSGIIWSLWIYAPIALVLVWLRRHRIKFFWDQMTGSTRASQFKF